LQVEQLSREIELNTWSISCCLFSAWVHSQLFIPQITRNLRRTPPLRRPAHAQSWTHVQLAFYRPGRNSDNAFCESFNNRVRQELLNRNWFTFLADARLQAAAWRIDYNTNHQHSSLGDLSSEEFARHATNTNSRAASSSPSVG